MTDHAGMEACRCSLTPEGLIRRANEWRELGKHSLSRTVEGGVVVSTYPPDPEVAQRLDELIAAEAECCTFLSFEVRPSPEGIEVSLRYPPGFEPMLALVIPDLAAERMLKSIRPGRSPRDGRAGT